MRGIRSVLAAVTASMTLVVAACGGGDGDDSGGGGDSGGGSVEVFTCWTSGSEAAALDSLITSFEAGQPGVEVVNGAVAGGGCGALTAVLQTRLQGSNPPDTWLTHPGEAIGQYIDGDLVADLSSIYETDGLAEAVPQPLIDAMSRDGKVYGASTGAHRGNVLWFNAELVAQAGVEPTAAMTPREFVAALETLDQAGITPLCLGAKDTFATAELFENTLLGVVGPEAWNALTTGERSWDDPAVREAAEVFAEILPYADTDSAALTWDQATQRLGEGQCAFESLGDFVYGELVNDGGQDGTDFGYIPHPGTDGSFILVVDTFVIARQAPHLDNAIAWAAAVSTKEAQLEFNRLKGSTPVRMDVDVSSLPAYQQEAADSYRNDTLVPSIVHGQATNPQFQQAFYDAVTQFAQSKDVDAFLLALANAA